MSNLPNAEQSPRVVNGVIKWYEGDTFTMDLGLGLTDQDGEAVTLNAADTVKVTFRDKGIFFYQRQQGHGDAGL